MDIFVAFSALILFSPVFILVAALVKLTSRGPLFFMQERAGSGGSYFKIVKFRTMAVDRHAEKKGFEPGSKKRITAVGKILRKTKIDELPQLFNVIIGEMSIVGPRPEVRPYVELYPDRWSRVLSEKPGITDPASIIFRNEEEILAASSNPEEEYRNKILPGKLDIYEEYVRGISFVGDIKIVFHTVFAVLLK